MQHLLLLLFEFHLDLPSVPGGCETLTEITRLLLLPGILPGGRAHVLDSSGGGSTCSNSITLDLDL
jgi:hypothetical protein